MTSRGQHTVPLVAHAIDLAELRSERFSTRTLLATAVEARTFYPAAEALLPARDGPPGAGEARHPAARESDAH